jgi:Domain of unknown function (DUF3291)
MAFISVTRLRIRSWFYVPQFLLQSSKSIKQAERSAGFLEGSLLRDRKNTFWTLTAWTDGAAMNAFRISGAHGAVMRRLLHWCDEASVVNWEQEASQLPAWKEAHHRMVKDGKLSKVNRPSPGQLSKTIPEPVPGRVELKLKASPKR